MAMAAPENPLKYVSVADIRGIAQLAAQATAGVTRIVEGVHQSVLGTMGIRAGKAPGRTRGIAGMVYKTVHDVALLVGTGTDTVLASLQPPCESPEQAPKGSDRPGATQRQAVLAVLNGVLGDRLLKSDNPLAIPMSFRYRGRALDRQTLSSMPGATAKVLLLIHGLCKNDLQWRRQHKGRKGASAGIDHASFDHASFDHGEALHSALGYTAVYLRYNSGLHTSHNGRELSARLEQLLAHWPVPIEELTVVAHSMGGLLIRSAVHYARQEALCWPEHLKNIVFLGTPHHGVPLARGANRVDLILGSMPYTRPFAALGQLRSAGITDLRYGHVLDEDWCGHNRFHRKADNRQVVPLPEGVACFTVAATMAARRSAMANHLIGDGLVPLHSALGQHTDAGRSMKFAQASQRVAYRTAHMDLLSSQEVLRQMVRWLAPHRPGTGPPLHRSKKWQDQNTTHR